MRVSIFYYNIRELIKAYGIRNVLDALEIERRRYCCKNPAALAAILLGGYGREALLEDVLGCAMLDSIIKCLKYEILQEEKCRPGSKVFYCARAIYDELKKEWSKEYMEQKYNELIEKIYYSVKRIIEYRLSNGREKKKHEDNTLED